MEQLTKGEIRQKAVLFLNNNSEFGILECDCDDLTKFAQSIFQEAEEETWKRVYKDHFKNAYEMAGARGYKLIAQIYHRERKRIENED